MVVDRPRNGDGPRRVREHRAEGLDHVLVRGRDLMSHATDLPHPYLRAALELARRPDLVERLLVDHPADGLTCPGCTVPGGNMSSPTPCSIRTLALVADGHARDAR